MQSASPEYELYMRAVNAARNELGTLRPEYERMAKRISQLEAFIANGVPLIPEGPQLPKLSFPPPAEDARRVRVSGPMPKWRAIVLSINGKRDRFSVGDALDALERIGRPVTSKNRFQIIRAELQRKTDVFAKLAPGLYAVKGDVEHAVA